MKTRKWFYFFSIVGALLLAVAAVPLAFAQGPNGENGYGAGRGMGFGPMHGQAAGRGMMQGGFGGPSQSLVAVTAEVLGLDQVDLVAELQAGQSLADVAEANGVEPQAIVAIFIADREAILAERVAEGRLSQDQVEAMLAAMEANITVRLSAPWTAQGYGPGTGFVDEDGDGWCDHHLAGQGFGMEHGRYQSQD
jgi:hypothetical protein